MPALDALRFATALRDRFSSTREEADIAATQGEWTSYMYSLLAGIAKRERLWWAGCAPSLRARSSGGEYREYLWDFTMYEPTKRAVWNLPRVIVEHENVHSLAAFRFDHWKTLLAAAPLRVAIGYTPHASKQDAWVKDINRTAQDQVHGWSQRPDVEDLIALGFWGMTKGEENFRFWRRTPGEVEWSELVLDTRRHVHRGRRRG